MKIFLVRHAESTKNIGNKFDSGKDAIDELTSDGLTEIKITADYFKKRKLENSVIITGTRKRAIESAQELSKLLNLPICIENSLVPINPGDLAGLSNEKAHLKYSKLMQNRILFSQNLISGYDLIFPNGDNLAEYENKIKKSLEHIFDNNNSYSNLLIITHRSVILAALNIYHKLLSMQDKDLYKYYPTPKGCIVEIDIKAEELMNIKFHGGISNWSNKTS